MLYFKALMQGMDDMPAGRPRRARRLEAEAAAKGLAGDARRAGAGGPGHGRAPGAQRQQRIQRALEVHRISGRPCRPFTPQNP
jgi:tRNA dimethylallyltransferase